MIELGLALSLHLGMQGDYNGIHPHIRYNNENYIAGVYYNSENNISTYIGKRWEFEDLGIEAGAVSGYSDAKIIPYGRITYQNFYIAPGFEDGRLRGAVLGYEIKY